MLGPLLQVHSCQRLFHPLLPLCPGDFLVNEGQLHILLSGELGDQVEALEHEADLPVPDPGKLIFGIVLNGRAVQEISAGVSGVQASDDIHQRGLAGAGRADNAHKFAGGNMQIGLVQSINLLASNLIDPGNILQIDHWEPPQPPIFGIPEGMPPDIPLLSPRPPWSLMPPISLIPPMPEKSPEVVNVMPPKVKVCSLGV